MKKNNCNYLVSFLSLVLLLPLFLAGQGGVSEKKMLEQDSLFLKRHQLAQNQWKQGEVINSLRNYLFLINELEKAKDSLIKTKIYVEVGLIYKSENLYEKSLEYFQKANSVHHFADSELKVVILENLGYLNSKLKKYELARSHFQAVLKQVEAKKDIKKNLHLLQLIVETYKGEGDFKNALQYHLKILVLSQQLNDKKNEIISLNNIAYSYLHLKEYENAIAYFKRTILLSAFDDGFHTELVSVYSNIAIAYQNIGKLDQSLLNLLEAKKILEKNRSVQELSLLYDLISVIYFNQKDYHNARSYNELALNIAEENNLALSKQATYKTSSLIYQELNDYKKALGFHKKHLSIRDSLMVEERLKQQGVLEQQFIVEKTEKELKLLLVGEEMKDLEIKRLHLESEKIDKENELLRKNHENQALRTRETLQELLLTQQQFEADKKEKQIQLLYKNEQLQSVLIKQKELQTTEKQKEIQLLTKDKAIDKLEIEKQLTFRKFMYGFSFLLLALIGFIFRSFLITRKSKRELELKNEEIYLQKTKIQESHFLIEQEKEKSELLLLNILPQKIAVELKESGSAKPQHYSKVTVMFTDFVGFTQITEATPHDQLFEELNYFFLKFDEIIEKHGVEKIKTIGDAYMCAGGVPEKNETNPVDVVAAGLEISLFMISENLDRVSKGLIPWGIRIGIHTGPVVAGVVGKNKFVYDIWGDAVNIASRVEENSIDGKVNISEETFNWVKDQFNCSYRGELNAKNKGKMAMYFVDSLKDSPFAPRPQEH